MEQALQDILSDSPGIHSIIIPSFNDQYHSVLDDNLGYLSGRPAKVDSDQYSPPRTGCDILTRSKSTPRR